MKSSFLHVPAAFAPLLMGESPLAAPYLALCINNLAVFVNLNYEFLILLCQPHNFSKIGVAFIFLTYIIDIVGDKWLNSADFGDSEHPAKGTATHDY